MRKAAPLFLIFGLGLAGVAGASTLFYWALGCDASGRFLEVYSRDLRTPLFTGCLTVGSFLLTLKAAILLRVKEVYDDPEYAKTFDSHCEALVRAKSSKTPGYYDSFKNLGLLMIAGVVITLLSAVAQMTLGLFGGRSAIAISLGFAATAMVFLLFIWWAIAWNLLVWFDTLKRPALPKTKTDQVAHPAASSAAENPQ